MMIVSYADVFEMILYILKLVEGCQDDISNASRGVSRHGEAIFYNLFDH